MGHSHIDATGHGLAGHVRIIPGDHNEESGLRAAGGALTAVDDDGATPGTFVPSCRYAFVLGK